MNQPKQPDRLSPGQLLRRARTTKHWSVEEIGQRLKLPTSVVKKIEQDQCDLSSDIYQRGYAVNYARLLDLDLDHFNKVLGEKQEEEIPLSNALSQQAGTKPSERLLTFATYFIGTVVVAIPLVWSLTDGAADFFTKNTLTADTTAPTLVTPANSQSNDTGLPEDPSLAPPQHKHMSASVAPLGALNPRPAASQESTVNDTAVSTTPEAAQTDDESLPTGTELESAETSSVDAAQADIVAVNTTAAPAGDALSSVAQSPAQEALALTVPTPPLRLSLQGDSWVEITDATGRRLEYDLVRGGSTTDYEGEAPYRILIGSATGVVLEHHGQLVDLAPHIRGNVASFELNGTPVTAVESADDNSE